ncbi:unnamed protein product [Rangifer tarandus platyrhynchus]|uniref:Collagen alpha-1(I) chain-like n=1 Tax=Rangifer tarandus platyrhynchus TaxID=3082113 RepID=A0ABN8YST2_RANTA|nr:unnamed protein product [Rangifer tarandus platyrhynchus]
MRSLCHMRTEQEGVLLQSSPGKQLGPFTPRRSRQGSAAAATRGARLGLERATQEHGGRARRLHRAGPVAAGSLGGLRSGPGGLNPSGRAPRPPALRPPGVRNGGGAAWGGQERAAGGGRHAARAALPCGAARRGEAPIAGGGARDRGLGADSRPRRESPARAAGVCRGPGLYASRVQSGASCRKSLGYGTGSPAPSPSEENGKIREVGCKPGKTRVNQGGRLAASDPESQAGFAGLPERIPAGRSAALPTPCPPVHPHSPAFADPGGGRRPGPELAERCPALVLWGQGLSAAPGACAAPGTQEDLKSASKKGILGATGGIPVLTGRQSCQRWLLDGLARETEDTSGVEDVPPNRFYKREEHSARSTTRRSLVDTAPPAPFQGT